MEHPNINWGMCRKLLPYKTEEQKKINAIRCEAEAKALMLKLATETHKQKQAREKLKETQRVMGKKNIVVYADNTKSVKSKLVSVKKTLTLLSSVS